MILLERNAEIGGFIATEERTLPGYLHDTFSSWHTMFVSGPAYAALGELLHRHGLEYRNTDDWVTASVADDGRATFAHRDPERTAAEFAHAEDRVRLSRHAATAGREHGVDRRPAGQRSGASLALVRHTFGLVRSGGLRGAEWRLARRSPAATRTLAGTSAARRSTTCTRRGCCMPGSPRTTPAAGS